MIVQRAGRASMNVRLRQFLRVIFIRSILNFVPTAVHVLMFVRLKQYTKYREIETIPLWKKVHPGVLFLFYAYHNDRRGEPYFQDHYLSENPSSLLRIIPGKREDLLIIGLFHKFL